MPIEASEVEDLSEFVQVTIADFLRECSLGVTFGLNCSNELEITVTLIDESDWSEFAHPLLEGTCTIPNELVNTNGPTPTDVSDGNLE